MTHSKQTTTTRAPLHVVGPQDGIVGPLRILAGSEQTDGQYFALEWETAPAGPGATVDLHAHADHDESEYVVTGEREIIADDQRWSGGAGLFVLAPRRAPHTMSTVGPQPSRWLHFFSPAGLERYFIVREHLRSQGATAGQMQALRELHGVASHSTRGADDPAVVSVPGTRLGGVVVTGEQTRNAYALRECSVLPEHGHAHADHEEAFYVISGELVVESEGVEVVAPERSFVVIPRHVRRRHVALAGTRVLAVSSPGDALLH